MYLPRRFTASMRAPRSLRLKDAGEMPARRRGRFTSTPTMHCPTTARRSPRTTCSTSGSSGIRACLSQDGYPNLIVRATALAGVLSLNRPPDIETTRARRWCRQPPQLFVLLANAPDDFHTHRNSVYFRRQFSRCWRWRRQVDLQAILRADRRDANPDDLSQFGKHSVSVRLCRARPIQRRWLIHKIYVTRSTLSASSTARIELP